MGDWWISSNDLDRDQRAVMAAPANGRFLVVGPPGSGKTNLLLLRARQLHLSGHKNFVLLTFTKGLQTFLTSGAERYKFPGDSIETSMGWLMRQVRSLGGDLEDLPEKFLDKRRELARRLVQQVELQEMAQLHSHILLDEVQDYTTDELDIFSRISPNLFMVGDSRQEIYQSEGIIEHAETITGATNSHKLTYHYRTAPEICKVADRFGKDSLRHTPILPTCNYKGPQGSAEIQKPMSLEEQFRAITDELEVQIDAYPKELLGVLCPKERSYRDFVDFMATHPLKDKTVFLRDPAAKIGEGRPIVVSTIHSAKGLEFRVVHLLAFETIKGVQNQRNSAYTAVTRAKTSVDIYHEGSFKGWLAEALAEEDLRELPPVEDLFEGI